MIPPAPCARASGAGCGSSAWSAQRPCTREAAFGLLGGELPGLGGYAGFFIKKAALALFQQAQEAMKFEAMALDLQNSKAGCSGDKNRAGQSYRELGADSTKKLS